MNTAFYIYGNMRLKEISILNLFEQIQENTISGLAFSARLGSGFHTDHVKHLSVDCLQKPIIISYKIIIISHKSVD